MSERFPEEHELTTTRYLKEKGKYSNEHANKEGSRAMKEHEQKHWGEKK